MAFSLSYNQKLTFEKKNMNIAMLFYVYLWKTNLSSFFIIVKGSAVCLLDHIWFDDQLFVILLCNPFCIFNTAINW